MPARCAAARPAAACLPSRTTSSARELAARTHELVERRAVDELHDEVGIAVGVDAEVVDLHDVGVGQARDRLRLATEARHEVGCGVQHHLDGDGAIELRIAPAIDGAHAALAQQLEVYVAPESCHAALLYGSSRHFCCYGEHEMSKGRMEAFSDGVIAIIITIMVLELKAPEHATWAGLCARWPLFLSYLLSFFFVGVYWVNHHHLLHSIRHVDGKILWLNLHLLFWLSLIPFLTRWLGEEYPEPVPAVAYGALMILAGIAWGFLQRAIAQQANDEERVAHRHQHRKTALAVAMAGAGMPLAAYGHVNIAIGLYAAVALSWAIPDRLLERAALEHGEHDAQS